MPVQYATHGRGIGLRSPQRAEGNQGAASVFGTSRGSTEPPSSARDEADSILELSQRYLSLRTTCDHQELQLRQHWKSKVFLCWAKFIIPNLDHSYQFCFVLESWQGSVSVA